MQNCIKCLVFLAMVVAAACHGLMHDDAVYASPMEDSYWRWGAKDSYPNVNNDESYWNWYGSNWGAWQQFWPWQCPTGTARWLWGCYETPRCTNGQTWNGWWQGCCNSIGRGIVCGNGMAWVNDRVGCAYLTGSDGKWTLESTGQWPAGGLLATTVTTCLTSSETATATDAFVADSFPMFSAEDGNIDSGFGGETYFDFTESETSGLVESPTIDDFMFPFGVGATDETSIDAEYPTGAENQDVTSLSNFLDNYDTPFISGESDFMVSTDAADSFASLDGFYATEFPSITPVGQSEINNELSNVNDFSNAFVDGQVDASVSDANPEPTFEGISLTLNDPFSEQVATQEFGAVDLSTENFLSPDFGDAQGLAMSGDSTIVTDNQNDLQLDTSDSVGLAEQVEPYSSLPNGLFSATESNAALYSDVSDGGVVTNLDDTGSNLIGQEPMMSESVV